MLDSLWVSIAVGTVLGFLSGLGIGGGSLLILWLTMVLKMNQAAARSINLLFFLPAAAIACILRCRQGTLPLKRIFPALLTGPAAAAAASWLGMQLDTQLLKKAFGILLLFTGLREVFYRRRV